MADTGFLKLAVNNDEDMDEHRQAVAAVRGSKEPPEDWLSKLPIGTTFLAVGIHEHGFMVDHFTILGESDKAMRLQENYDKDYWVIPHVFCTKMKKLEILEYGIVEELKDDADHPV